MARPKQFESIGALDLAVRGFWRWGYHAASMDMLVKAMCVSRQSLYDTFGDKRNLFEKAMDRYESTMLECELQPLRNAENAMDGILKVAAGWTSLSRYGLGEPRGCLLTNALCELQEIEPELHSLCRETERRFESRLRFAVEKASEEGSMPLDSEPTDIAGQLVLMRHGLMVARRSGADDRVFRRAGYDLPTLLEK